MTWRDERRAWARPVVAAAPMGAVERVAPTRSPEAVVWPVSSTGRSVVARPLDLAGLLSAFTVTFSKADAEIDRVSGGRVRMTLDESSIEIETRWLRFQQGRIEVLF